MARNRRATALLPLLAAGLVGCVQGQIEDAAPASAAVNAELVFTMNGLSSLNGLTSNGLSTLSGLSMASGLESTSGLMTTDSGRTTVKYLVRCALAAGDSLTKADQDGVMYIFPGELGLAPSWKTGACDGSCQQAISACLLAHINTTGIHIPLWLVAPDPAIGWGTDPQYPNREASFFGNIFAPNPTSGAVDAFYCEGAGFSNDTVPGRLGSHQTGAPYMDPYTSAANPSGDCTPCSATAAEGPNDCTADGVKYTPPITVWRGQTFQAEKATFTNGASVIHCPSGACSADARVGYIGPSSTVTFDGVFASSTGSRVLMVYFANGDACSGACYRYFTISVNGSAPQNFAFPVVKPADWDAVAGAPVHLSGFVAGAANTVVFKGDGVHSAPDLDWIEVE
jgi:hypothetical protein